MKTKLFFLFAAFALLLSVNAVAQSNGDVNAPAYYYYIGQDPITADNYTTLAETSDTLLKEKEYTTERYGYMYVLCPNSVTSIKVQQPGLGFWSDDSFIIDTSVSIPGHTVFKTTGKCGAHASILIQFDYTPVAETYYYYYGIQEGTVQNPSSPINADNYKTLAESSTTLKDSMTIKMQKGYAYVLVPNMVTEIKAFDLTAGVYSTMKFNVIDTSIPGHLVYMSERPFSGGNARLDFTYGEVDNNYYYYYGIQEGTVQNPSSPINADNYKTLAESSTTLKDSMTIKMQKGYAYVLVPNMVTEIKAFDLTLNAYSTMHFEVVDTSIPGHYVYKSEKPFSGGTARLYFTYGEVDNNYYYYYGIQEGTVQNPSSPINASNYKTLAESSSELKESLSIHAQKGYAYVLVPNSVTEVKWFDLNMNMYSTMKFNVMDTSIPGHLVYRSERPFSGGNVRLDFTSGGCNVILDRTSVERVIYDMSGRKLTDVEKLRSGIYIVNGRKLIVK